MKVKLHSLSFMTWPLSNSRSLKLHLLVQPCNSNSDESELGKKLTKGGFSIMTSWSFFSILQVWLINDGIRCLGHDLPCFIALALQPLISPKTAFTNMQKLNFQLTPDSSVINNCHRIYIEQWKIVYLLKSSGNDYKEDFVNIL